jgi:hypothetical protein
MYDYVIIGGGISGLYNYIKLHEKNHHHKIRLLEKNDYFGGRIKQHEELYKGNHYSIPCGAARFNSNHESVIKLMKKFKLLDMRKDKGQLPTTKFIDCKHQFNKKYDNAIGFKYIDEVLKHAKNTNPYILKHFTFLEFAKRYLTPKEVDFILNSCGYSGQLKHMNMFDAYNLFTNGIRQDLRFWLGKFQILINAMLNYLKNIKAEISLRATASSIAYDGEKRAYKVVINHNSFIYTNKLVFCIPKEALLKMNILKPIFPILEKSITTKPLCRVYAIFDPLTNPWLRTLRQKITTNNELRFIIPIDPEKGLIMISYTDDEHTKFWHKRKNNQLIMKRTIVKLVNDTFNIKINEPLKVITCFWKSGVAYWNSNINSDQISKFLINPMPNIYICGENYSQTQSWVEGALQTCNQFLLTQ